MDMTQFDLSFYPIQWYVWSFAIFFIEFHCIFIHTYSSAFTVPLVYVTPPQLVLMQCNL